MRTFISVMTATGILLAILNVATLFYGFSTDRFMDGSSMAILMHKLWAAIGALLALLFGFLGRFSDRRQKRPVALISKVGIGIGIFGGLLVIVFPYL